MAVDVDEGLLDDPERLRLADPGEMLRAVSSAGAQVRQTLALSARAGLHRLGDAGRPRAIVVAGMGGSGIAGHVLQAVAGTGSPVPIERVRGWTLPAWVGPLDLVIAVSSSGSTAETRSCFAEARRRGSQVVAVSRAGSPLADAAHQAGVPWVEVPDHGLQPRASMWALSVPLLVVARELGVVEVSDAMFEAAAGLLDELSSRCGPAVDTDDNPAKTLALELAGALPMIWGSSDLAGIAAYRFLCQLAENAKYPAVNGVLPEALHNQVVTFDGPFVSTRAADVFYDPMLESERPSPNLRLVMMRDSQEHHQVSRAREIATDVARERGIPVSEVVAVHGSALERLAALVAVTDFASVYLALALGVDPTPIPPIEAIKARMAGGEVPAGTPAGATDPAGRAGGR